MQSFIKSAVAGAFGMMAVSNSASAHPHVFVTARTIVQVEAQQVTGLQHAWTFDEMYASDAVTGLDINGDGKVDRKELQALAQTNMDGLKEFNYFTTAEVAGKPVAFKDPVDYWLDYNGGLLTLHFTLPLMQPIPEKGEVLSFAVEDPSYYIAFDFAKDEAVRFSSSILSGCKANPPAVSVTDDQQRLSDAFSAQFDPSGGSGANSFTITCPP